MSNFSVGAVAQVFPGTVRQTCLRRALVSRSPTKLTTTTAAARLFQTLRPLSAASPRRGQLSRTAPPTKALPTREGSATAPNERLTSPATATPAGLATRYAYARALAQKGHPTLLYEAPSHGWYRFSGWMASTMCFTSGYYVIAVFNAGLEGVPQWIHWTYSVTGFSLAVMGTYWFLRGKDIVNSVRVLPGRKEGPPTAQQQGAAPSLDVEVTVKSLFPLLGPRAIVAPLDEVSVGTRVVDPDMYFTNQERLEKKRQDEREAEEKRRYELAHLYTAPFRHAGRGIKAFWDGSKKFISYGGFGTLVIKGKLLKLDIEDGWHLDEGRALEKLLGAPEEVKMDATQKWQQRLFRK